MAKYKILYALETHFYPQCSVVFQVLKMIYITYCFGRGSGSLGTPGGIGSAPVGTGSLGTPVGTGSVGTPVDTGSVGAPVGSVLLSTGAASENKL